MSKNSFDSFLDEFAGPINYEKVMLKGPTIAVGVVPSWLQIGARIFHEARFDRQGEVMQNPSGVADAANSPK